MGSLELVSEMMSFTQKPPWRVIGKYTCEEVRTAADSTSSMTLESYPKLGKGLGLFFFFKFLYKLHLGGAVGLDWIRAIFYSRGNFK